METESNIKAERDFLREQVKKLLDELYNERIESTKTFNAAMSMFASVSKKLDLTLKEYLELEAAIKIANMTNKRHKEQIDYIHKFLDRFGITRTASGGEGDAEVEINIIDRIRILGKTLDKNFGW